MTNILDNLETDIKPLTIKLVNHVNHIKLGTNMLVNLESTTYELFDFKVNLNFKIKFLILKAKIEV